MTGAEKSKAFNKARREAIKGRTAILRDTRAEILRLLKLAQADITAVLAAKPSDYQRWMLPQISKEISRVMAEFGDTGAAALSTASGRAWQAGQDLIDAPLAAAGIRIAGIAPRLDTGHLMAMRAFMADRIKDVGTSAANKINSELGLVVIGAQAPGDAIGRVAEILRDTSRARATTIVRTELGRVFSVASQARLESAAAVVPGMRKKWLKSGRLHPRLGHAVAHGQTVAAALPFEIIAKTGEIIRMMHPHDPEAPAAETINCGCISVPVVPGLESMVGKPGGAAYTKEELRSRAALFAEKHGLYAPAREAFNPGQARDAKGQWVKGGGIHAELTGKELGDRPDTKALRKAARMYAEQHLIGKSFANANSGHTIKITRQGIKHSLSRSNVAEVKLLAGLPDILKNAQYQGSEPDKHGRVHIKAAHKYLAKVKVGQETLHVGIVTHEKWGGHEHYDHFIVSGK